MIYVFLPLRKMQKLQLLLFNWQLIWYIADHDRLIKNKQTFRINPGLVRAKMPNFDRDWD